jgi:hypothetical protein
MTKPNWTCGLLLTVFAIQAYAGEKDLKNIYTAITNKVNSAILTRRGSNEITGSASFQSLKTEYDSGLKTTEQLLDADLGTGRFIVDNLSLGILFSLTNQHVTENLSNQKKSVNQVWIGPYVNKYFGNDRIRPFLSAEYLFLRGDVFDGGEADMGLGLLIHASGNMGITVQAKYGVSPSGSESIHSRNRLLFAVGMTHFIL